MINFEGGAIPEEYHTAYIVDRVNTTATVWLGLTVGCAQCHDHKYDPLTQKEFYQLYAFFNNVPENGLDGRKGNATPLVKVPTPPAAGEVGRAGGVDRASWRSASSCRTRKSMRRRPSGSRRPRPSSPSSGLPLDATDFASAGGRDAGPLRRRFAPGLRARTRRRRPIALTLAGPLAATDGAAARGAAGRELQRQGSGPLGERQLRAHRRARRCRRDAAQSAKPRKFKEATADYSQKDFPVAAAIDGKPDTGWAIYPAGRQAAHGRVRAGAAARRRRSRPRSSSSWTSNPPFAQHQFGRFRLSGTDSKDPHGKQTLPANDRDRSWRSRTDRARRAAVGGAAIALSRRTSRRSRNAGTRSWPR